MRRKRIKSYFGEEIHTISFSHMTEAKELLAEKEESVQNSQFLGNSVSYFGNQSVQPGSSGLFGNNASPNYRSPPVPPGTSSNPLLPMAAAIRGQPNYDNSKAESETKAISYPTTVEHCKDYIKLYCHWQVGNFADRIRKLFEYHFIKSMHDYFEQSKFLNKMYPTLQQLMSTEGITEKELIENSAEIRTREELERRKERAAVYDSMLKEMTKLGRKITDMGNGNYGKTLLYECRSKIIASITYEISHKGKTLLLTVFLDERSNPMVPQSALSDGQKPSKIRKK